MRAGIYVGIAGIDPNFTPEEKQRLESAFQSWGVEHTVEVYPDVKHGFAVNDTSVYDCRASERHWQKNSKVIRRTPLVAIGISERVIATKCPRTEELIAGKIRRLV
jgi:dienelactone hydrolase